MEHRQNKSEDNKEISTDITLYDVLGISPDATGDEIRQNYLIKAKMFHPDKLKGDNRKFMMVQKAWEILRDNESRAKYDQSLGAANKSIKSSIIYEIDLDDCEYDESNEEYKANCRCGEKIMFNCDDLEQGIEFFPCPSCSLLTKVLYEIVED